MSKKIKVVLLCHYWSDEMAGLVGRKHYFQELSPWIQEKINLFKNKDDVEYHVVAPNYASNEKVECIKDNIHYHFYHYSPTWLSVIVAPFIRLFLKHPETLKIAERLANTITGFKIPTKEATKIIKHIKPDLIHLSGSENPDYAAPAVKLLNNYPILLSVQGFVCAQPNNGGYLNRKFYGYRVLYERQINDSVEYVASSRRVSLEEYKDNEYHFFNNCKALFFVNVITKVPKENASITEKNYDVVYYARIDRNKGIEDLIEAIAFLRNKGRALKTLIMGRGGEDYVGHLKRIIKEKDLETLIDFAGFIENHDDVYKLAAQARLLVLPTHNDGIPNTIREAMFMKLPVVANNVGGIPRFNENRHCVHLVELGDIEGLAAGICKLLDDDNYREELINNAYQEAYEVYSPDAVYDQTIAVYKDVYSHANGLQ